MQGDQHCSSLYRIKVDISKLNTPISFADGRVSGKMKMTRALSSVYVDYICLHETERDYTLHWPPSQTFGTCPGTSQKLLYNFPTMCGITFIISLY